MKVKIMSEKYKGNLEKKINNFLEENKIKPIHIETKPVIREKTINQVESYQKKEIYEHEYMATIIYEG